MTLENALSTLKEAHTRFFVIEGADKFRLSHEPEEDAAATEAAATEQFEKLYARLLPGTYRVTFREKRTARTNADAFRFTVGADVAGGAPTVAGFNPLGAFADPAVQALRDTVYEMRLREALRDQADAHRRELEKVAGGGDFNLDRVAGLIGKATEMFNAAARVQGARPALPAPPRVAAPAPVPTAPPLAYENDETARFAAASETLASALGGEQQFLAAMEKLAGVAQRDPGQIATALSFLG